MDLRALAGKLRRKFDHDARPRRDALMNRMEIVERADLERQMVQSNISLPIECDEIRGIKDLPKGYTRVAIAYECRRVAWSFAEQASAKAIRKKMGGLLEIGDRQTDMVDTLREDIALSRFTHRSRQLKESFAGKRENWRPS